MPPHLLACSCSARCNFEETLLGNSGGGIRVLRRMSEQCACTVPASCSRRFVGVRQNCLRCMATDCCKLLLWIPAENIVVVESKNLLNDNLSYSINNVGVSRIGDIRTLNGPRHIYHGSAGAACDDTRRDVMSRESVTRDHNPFSLCCFLSRRTHLQPALWMLHHRRLYTLSTSQTSQI